MTPQSHIPRRRVAVRRSAALLTMALVVVGTPLIAQALGSDAPSQQSQVEALVADRPIERTSRARVAAIAWQDRIDDVAIIPQSTPPPEPAPQPEPEPEPAVDPVIVLLIDSYEWDEQGPRVSVLQETIGIAPDGVYGQVTWQAHRAALDFLGLSLEVLPDPVIATGPSEAEWEALRWCESNGNYEITNPSGKYRGAYQFDQSTWDSVADRHAPHLVGSDPAAATPTDQDFMARALYSERGARPWPNCGRHLS